MVAFSISAAVRPATFYLSSGAPCSLQFSIGVSCILHLSSGAPCSLKLSSGVPCNPRLTNGAPCSLHLSSGVPCSLYLNSGAPCSISAAVPHAAFISVTLSFAWTQGMPFPAVCHFVRAITSLHLVAATLLQSSDGLRGGCYVRAGFRLHGTERRRFFPRIAVASAMDALQRCGQLGAWRGLPAPVLYLPRQLRCPTEAAAPSS